MLSSAPLNARLMLSATESLNELLERPFQDFLGAMIGDDRQHARFLNMLSMLEHIGSRKIMLSQMNGVLTQDILRHLAEETKHAVFFKREAEKLSRGPLDGYPDDQTMCVASGKFYFGRLDIGLTADLAPGMHSEAGYLWVSFVIELRAIWVYRRYQAVLTAAGHRLSLKGIIAEEDRHLIEMAARLDEIGFDSTEAAPIACMLEKRLFEKLLCALQQNCPMPKIGVAQDSRGDAATASPNATA